MKEGKYMDNLVGKSKEDLEKIWSNAVLEGAKKFCKEKGLPYDAENIPNEYKVLQKKSPDKFYKMVYVGDDNKAKKEAMSLYKEINKAQKWKSVQGKISKTLSSKIADLSTDIKTDDIGIDKDSIEKILNGNTQKKEAKAKIDTLSKRLINHKLEDIMIDSIEKEKAKYGLGVDLSKEGREKIREIIRSHKYVEFNNEDMIKIAQGKTKAMLDDYVKKEVYSQLNLQQDKLLKQTSVYRAQVDKFSSKLESLNKLSEEELTKKIADNLDNAILKVNAITSTSNKLESLDEKLAKVGLNPKLAKSFEKVIGNVTKDISGPLEKKLKPQIEKKIEATRVAAATIKNAEEAIKKYKEAAEKAVKAMEDKAMAALKEREKVWINTLTSSIKLKF